LFPMRRVRVHQGRRDIHNVFALSVRFASVLSPGWALAASVFLQTSSTPASRKRSFRSIVSRKRSFHSLFHYRSTVSISSANTSVCIWSHTLCRSSSKISHLTQLARTAVKTPPVHIERSATHLSRVASIPWGYFAWHVGDSS